MREVSKDLHPDFTLDRVSSAVFQRQPVRGRAYGRGPDDMSLHLDALWWRLWRCGPVGWGAPVKAQGSDLTRVEVAQLPGGTVHLFGLEVRPLIAEVDGFTEKPLGLLVLHLGLHFDRLAVLGVEAIVGLLDVLVQGFAQLSAQLPVRQAALVASFGARAFLLGLAAGLAAGAGLWRAAVRLVTVPDWCFDELAQKFILEVVVALFHVTKGPLSLRSHTKEMVSPSVVIVLVPAVLLLLLLDLMQKLGQIRLVGSFLLENKKNTMNESCLSQ